MTRATPLVSIIMASYNHARFVTQAIESVWRQTYRNIEIVIIDDGSTDNSVEVIERLQSRSPIPFDFKTQQNAGPATTFNRALGLATGEWIAILASDDYYSPNFIELNLSEAALIGEDDTVQHSNAFLVEHDGRITGTMDGVSQTSPLCGQAFELLINGGGRLLPSTMFLRRELLLRAGAFDPAMLAEDLDLQLRLARMARFHYIEQPIFYSRHSPGSLGKKPWLWGDSIITSIAKHHDVLGSRLPPLLARASSNVSAHCVEYGEWGHGLKWARRAIGHARGSRAKASTAMILAGRIARATARNAAIRLIGRERLVSAKRILIPVRKVD